MIGYGHGIDDSNSKIQTTDGGITWNDVSGIVNCRS